MPHTIANYFQYENITFKTFFEIATSGNYLLLGKNKFCTFKGCAEAWEEILKRNGSATGDLNFHNYKILEEERGILMAQYNVAKAMISKLRLIVDLNDIEYLKRLGYKFNFINSKGYEDCLDIAERRAEGILTRLKMKENELQDFTSEAGEPVTFGQLMAQLRFETKASISDELLLTEYNEYKKIIQQRNARNKPG